MEPTRDLEREQRHVMFEDTNYGHLMARMEALERSVSRLVESFELQNTFDQGKWKTHGRDDKKSYTDVSSENESGSKEEDDNHAGFCAFPAIICSSSESESESDIEDNKIEVSAKVVGVVSRTHSDSEDEDEPLEYEDLARQLIELTKETIELIKEKEVMKEELRKEKEKSSLMEQELQETIELIKEKEVMKEELRKEKEKSSLMEQELLETKKKIQMLNSGTKDLEKILSMGKTEKGNYGLGYKGETSSSNANVIQPVRRNTSQDVPANQYVRRNTSQHVPTTFQNRAIERRTSYGCYYCGKHGHIKRHCYSFKAKVRNLMNQQRFYPNYRDVSYVYMRNEDLYKKEGEAIKSDIFELKKHEPKWQQDNIKKYDKWYLSQAESEFLNELCQTRRGREVLDEGGSFVSN